MRPLGGHVAWHPKPRSASRCGRMRGGAPRAPRDREVSAAASVAAMRCDTECTKVRLQTVCTAVALPNLGFAYIRQSYMFAIRQRLHCGSQGAGHTQLPRRPRVAHHCVPWHLCIRDLFQHPQTLQPPPLRRARAP